MRDNLRRLAPLERIWAQIEPEPMSGCWLWAGSLSTEGYGQTYYNGRSRQAHRVVYELIGHKSIPAGLLIDHLCRVRCCVNPDHIEPTTNKENILRGVGITAQNARKAVCARGHSDFVLDPRGHRRCRTCHLGYSRDRYLRFRSEGPRDCPYCGKRMAHSYSVERHTIAFHGGVQP